MPGCQPGSFACLFLLENYFFFFAVFFAGAFFAAFFAGDFFAGLLCRSLLRRRLLGCCFLHCQRNTSFDGRFFAAGALLVADRFRSLSAAFRAFAALLRGRFRCGLFGRSFRRSLFRRGFFRCCFGRRRLGDGLLGGGLFGRGLLAGSAAPVARSPVGKAIRHLEGWLRR